jgi:signal transduction histidine kinase
MLKSKKQIILLGSLTLIIVGIIDFYLVYEIASLLLYIVPIFLVSYQNRISQKYVILFSLIVGTQWAILDLITHPYTKEIFLYWNSFSRFALFLLISIILKRIVIEKEQRRIIEKQKKELEEINKELLDTNIELNKFIGMAAHDIRNPVGNILSFSELLLENKEINDTEKRRYLEYINTCSKHSLEILNNTLNISQIQSGKVILNKSKNDYIAFIKECIILNNQFAVRKEQNIRFFTDIDSILIEFDKSRLQQVVNNLLSNAIKYSEFKTDITIKVSYFEKYTKNIITEIIDQGVGIDDEYKQSIFEPFKTATNKPTNNEIQTGLGLAIAKKIIELHDGIIDFKSEKGKGTNFFFIIPI